MSKSILLGNLNPERNNLINNRQQTFMFLPTQLIILINWPQMLSQTILENSPHLQHIKNLIITKRVVDINRNHT